MRRRGSRSTSSVAMETGARFIGEFKRTRTLDITQRSPDVD